MEVLQLLLDGIRAFFSLQGEATAFDYAVRELLRGVCSVKFIVPALGTLVSVRAWRRAMAAEDYSVKAWALDRGLKGHAHASRQLAGEKPISQHDIEAAPANVQRWYHLFRLEELGLPPITMTAADVQRRLERIA